MASEIQVSVDTIRRWISTLELIYYSFRIKPYSKNITRAILKEPKIYLWDWSMAEDEGKRNENVIASHLLKAIDFYNDSGLGSYDLFYLKDKDKKPAYKPVCKMKPSGLLRSRWLHFLVKQNLPSMNILRIFKRKKSLKKAKL